MTLKSYLWGMRLSTLVAFVAFLVVINTIDPGESGLIEQIFFYLSFWLFVSGIFILSLTWIRKIFVGEDATFLFLGMSFRQGVLLSGATTFALFLQSYRLLSWWDALLVFSGFFLIELYFLSR